MNDVEDVEDVRKMYNEVIEYAISLHYSETQIFLTMWTEGDWESIREEFPDFSGFLG